ncbi:ATP dependent DNA ligase-like protein [Kribbella orskensis]|uniref:ATP dependent DNA ligase-like protein n=1 Tax=Kribbella orskensis TaxID=2512216 RepID=A0ABY2B996_9ACTN|nr:MULTISPECIES: hypothetical protein [Kribbella]TCN32154.1 ATP dependent DNA ligase-like protein [Kribbella sp. VKM Ac-2500]TCO12173.1 ATP dependent DNA ligase-like protein [Kribbella orskensis]
MRIRGRRQPDHVGVVDMSTTPTTSNAAQPSDRLKINGELVILGADGRLSFDALQRRLVTSPAKARNLVSTVPASYVAFDLLAIGGVDLRTQRWTVRRRRLEQLAAAWALPMQLSPVTDDLEEAQEWFDVLPDAMGVEGLVVKGAGSRYVGGRRDWLKVKHRATEEVLVGGVLGLIDQPEVVIAGGTAATTWSGSAEPSRSPRRSPPSSAPYCVRPSEVTRGRTRSPPSAGAAGIRRSR